MSMSKRKGKKEEEKEADKAQGDKAADAKETKEKDKKEGKGEAKSPKTKKKGEEDGKEEGAKETKDKDKKEGKDKKKEGEDKEEVEAPKDDKDKDKESITTSGKKKSKSGKEEVKKEETKKDEKKSKTKSRDDEKVARKDTKGKGKKDVEEEPEEEAKEEEEEEVVEQKPYDADSSVYVHRDGVVFVYEKRDVKVGDDKAVVIKELPASLVPSSLHFRSLSDPAASLSEQTFLDGSQSLSQLLAESRGKQVAIRLQKAGSASIQGKVVEVAADDVSILREDDDAVVVIPRALIALIEVSNKAVDTSPTLRAVLDTETPGEHKVELTYGAEGVTWSADYSLLLLSKTEAEVTGWYTVNNRSGKDFHNTAFTVVAEVSGYTPPPKHKTGVIGTIWSKTSSVLSPRESEGSHRGVRKEQVKYYLPRPLTIGGHETKQVRLVSGKVPVTTANFFNGSPYHYTAGTTVTTSANPVNKVLQPVVRFENSKTVHPSLGVVLPAGSLDVFQRTHGGTFLDLVYQYHTERAHPGDTLNCIIGPEKPWLTAERKSVEFKHDNKRHVMTETVQIEIRNRSNKGEDVLVEESLYRAKEYQITHATPKPTTDVKDSHVLLWQLRVKRESTAVIKYQVVYNNVPN